MNRVHLEPSTVARLGRSSVVRGTSFGVRRGLTSRRVAALTGLGVLLAAEAEYTNAETAAATLGVVVLMKALERCRRVFRGER